MEEKLIRRSMPARILPKCMNRYMKLTIIAIMLNLLTFCALSQVMSQKKPVLSSSNISKKDKVSLNKKFGILLPQTLQASHKYKLKESQTNFFLIKMSSENVKEFASKIKNTKMEGIVKAIEAVLKNASSKKEEVIWQRELSFPKNERVFNFFRIADAHFKKNIYYFLYFERLELRVATALEEANGWRSKNDSFLEDTSESRDPNYGVEIHRRET